jgi:glucose/arabinose dehydrogenase
MYTRKIIWFVFVALLAASGIVWWDTRTSAVAAPNAALPTISFVPVVSGLSLPTSITHAGDGSNRIFVTEKVGRIRIIKNGVLQATPFLDISARVNSAGSEQGLLSVAFPPNYASKKYFYVYYTDKNGIGDTMVSRFHLTNNPDIADPNSEEIILTQTQPETNHNGGQLQFGRDGFLYIGLGDGGGGGDPHGTFGNAQNPATLLGKILRIDTEPHSTQPGIGATGAFTYYFPVVARGSNSFNYSIPITNPYASTAGYRGEIWALGLRNPWRFSFDRATGDLYIGDVGQNAWEEIDFQPASSHGGENYGWRCYEGNHAYNTTGCAPQSSYVAPIAEYDHSQGCSVTGGYVYRGATYATMQGVYFFADFCNGKVWGYQSGSSAVLATAPSSVSTFGEDQAGELYLAGYGNGTLYKIASP